MALCAGNWDGPTLHVVCLGADSALKALAHGGKLNSGACQALLQPRAAGRAPAAPPRLVGWDPFPRVCERRPTIDHSINLDALNDSLFDSQMVPSTKDQVSGGRATCKLLIVSCLKAHHALLTHQAGQRS